MCSSHVSLGLEIWEEEFPRRCVREEGLVDEPWVEEVGDFPGGGVSPSRLTEHGGPSTLESSLTSSASASSAAIDESTMGDVCYRSAFTYFRRTSEPLDRRVVLATAEGGARHWRAAPCRRGALVGPARCYRWQQGRAWRRTDRHHRKARRQWHLIGAAFVATASRLRLTVAGPVGFVRHPVGGAHPRERRREGD
jgi:hypothetical protein